MSATLAASRTLEFVRTFPGPWMKRFNALAETLGSVAANFRVDRKIPLRWPIDQRQWLNELGAIAHLISRSAAERLHDAFSRTDEERCPFSDARTGVEQGDEISIAMS
jgi:hypothetical protein